MTEVKWNCSCLTEKEVHYKSFMAEMKPTWFQWWKTCYMHYITSFETNINTYSKSNCEQWRTGLCIPTAMKVTIVHHCKTWHCLQPQGGAMIRTRYLALFKFRFFFYKTEKIWSNLPWWRSPHWNILCAPSSRAPEKHLVFLSLMSLQAAAKKCNAFTLRRKNICSNTNQHNNIRTSIQ